MLLIYGIRSYLLLNVIWWADFCCLWLVDCQTFTMKKSEGKKKKKWRKSSILTPRYIFSLCGCNGSLHWNAKLQVLSCAELVPFSLETLQMGESKRRTSWCRDQTPCLAVSLGRACPLGTVPHRPVEAWGDLVARCDQPSTGLWCGCPEAPWRWVETPSWSWCFGAPWGWSRELPLGAPCVPSH